jgi:hypothetical protein
VVGWPTMLSTRLPSRYGYRAIALLTFWYASYLSNICISSCYVTGICRNDNVNYNDNDNYDNYDDHYNNDVNDYDNDHNHDYNHDDNDYNHNNNDKHNNNN